MCRSTPLIRRLRRGDLGQVCRIEEEVFPMPWSRESFENELSDNGVSFSWVLESGGAVVGYLISWLVEDELHIGNIAVAPELQGSGLGRDLLERCLGEAAATGVSRATLEVRVTNERAIALYEKHGFRPIAFRRRYYSDTGEDALVMLKDFPQKGGQG